VPETSAEDHDIVAARPRVGVGEAASEGGRDAKQAKKARLDAHALHADDRRPIAEREVDDAPGGRVGEHRRARAPFDVVRRHGAGVWNAARQVRFADLHEAVGVGIGQRPQQHGAREAEDRGVDAEAERQRGDHDGREDRTGGQRANRSAHRQRSS
jgi:hypothetical protein